MQIDRRQVVKEVKEPRKLWDAWIPWRTSLQNAELRSMAFRQIPAHECWRERPGKFLSSIPSVISCLIASGFVSLIVLICHVVCSINAHIVLLLL